MNDKCSYISNSIKAISGLYGNQSYNKSNLYKTRIQLTQSFQNSYNSLEAFKPLFKIGFFSLILLALLKGWKFHMTIDYSRIHLK